MQKPLSIVLFVLLTVMGCGLSVAKAGNPVTAGLNHRYTICFSSDETTEEGELQGAYVRFSLKAGIGAVYDFRLSDEQHVEGRVESYNEREGERDYVLAAFFDRRANARFRVVDMPNCDNLKVAVLYYADEREDPAETYLQYILIDEDFIDTPNYHLKQ